MPPCCSEFRAIAFVKELIAAGRMLSHGEFRDIRMHRIDADEAFKDLSASSKIVWKRDCMIAYDGRCFCACSDGARRQVSVVRW